MITYSCDICKKEIKDPIKDSFDITVEYPYISHVPDQYCKPLVVRYKKCAMYCEDCYKKVENFVSSLKEKEEIYGRALREANEPIK